MMGEERDLRVRGLLQRDVLMDCYKATGCHRLVINCDGATVAKLKDTVQSIAGSASTR